MKSPVSVRFATLACASIIGLCLDHSDAQVVVVDEVAMRPLVAADAKVEKLADGMKFIEGPVWLGKGEAGRLIFSDIPANELKEWSPEGGLKIFRTPSNNTNGNTLDLEGRLVSAEHSARRVSRTESDGTVVTVVDRVDGKRFNSPNDVVVKSDGTFWFTDPPYGLPRDQPKELDGHFVFRHDPKNGQTTKVSAQHDMPNGLAFSPDEKRLYVADSGRPRHILVYDVREDGTLSEGKVFCTIDKGGPDGIRVDAAGNIWSSAGDGVQIFDPSGRLVGRILCPESPANLAFGGPDGKWLFMTSRTSLYRVLVAIGPSRRPAAR
ncbi:MAG: SMP-30/gluconolactonase/LRE family protein [Verrucomicrobiales bacterium]